MPSPSIRDHLRAACVLVVCVALLMAGFPGLDFVGPKQRDGWAETARGVAAPLGTAVDGVVLFDRHLRRRIARWVKPVERVFRVSQEFHLYRDGPTRVDRLEVLVDGEVVYRTRDPERAWRAAELGNRRFRPMVATAAQKADAENQRGIARWIITAARQDFPGAAEVVIRSTRTRFGVEEPWVRFSRVARGPEWTVSAVQKEKAP